MGDTYDQSSMQPPTAAVPYPQVCSAPAPTGRPRADTAPPVRVQLPLPSPSQMLSRVVAGNVDLDYAAVRGYESDCSDALTAFFHRHHLDPDTSLPMLLQFLALHTASTRVTGLRLFGLSIEYIRATLQALPYDTTFRRISRHYADTIRAILERSDHHCALYDKLSAMSLQPIPASYRSLCFDGSSYCTGLSQDETRFTILAAQALLAQSHAARSGRDVIVAPRQALPAPVATAPIGDAPHSVVQNRE